MLRIKLYLVLLLFSCSLDINSTVNEIVFSFESTRKVKIMPLTSKIVRIQLSDTTGVFQFDFGSEMQRLCMEFKPKTFNGCL